ncbi:HMA2 domain-containing protein [Methylomagnum ishizawai]|uniref:HMA2 domain-containing protein n=1 Tax=Methylomagnum ishizawai TaxID=1760988 RepID=UPI001C31EC0F|nr:hypothetical protein [Methylomagnum ishizawai]BBL75101.1 hypothetical protein MishRS11D_21990 [Methylomagnum ishizawai]
MKHIEPPAPSVVHNQVPGRIRLLVPVIKHKRTFAGLLRQNLLKGPAGKGIYHAEPNIVTGTVLIKYHRAVYSETEILRWVERIARKIALGEIEITAKHKNPRLGKMLPGAFFTRELLVSICGNVIAGLVLAAMVSG